MPKTPSQYYNDLCKQGRCVFDPTQSKVLIELDFVFTNLLNQSKYTHLRKWIGKTKPVLGAYLWGGVGGGKTLLLDCFYQCAPVPKMRLHFHAFMQYVHAELKARQGLKNPLRSIAKELRNRTQLLCFDEFSVTDIVDAMILGNLFSKLFASGLCIIATSNLAPDDLYRRGLQRELFLPTIALLKEHLLVLHNQTGVDYRMQSVHKGQNFYQTNDPKSHAAMENLFVELAGENIIHHDPIEICGRKIKIKKQADDIVWFNFNDICRPPRSVEDYLQLAKQYKTIFISDIPAIEADANNTISLFIRMIDVFYDARIRLVISLLHPLDEIYTQGSMLFEYARTQSRLIEMQSDEFLVKATD